MNHKAFLTIILVIALFSGTMAGTFDASEKISLQFEDVPISTVLNMMAQQYNLNLVQSGQIEGTISIRLENVVLEDALQAILASNGYNYYLSGDIVVIKPIEMTAVGEMVAKTIALNHISPDAAVCAAEDLLSPKGKIKVIRGSANGGTSVRQPIPDRIVVVDLLETVKTITEFVKTIDKPEPQIAIEVRMIEMNVDTERKAGFKWPTSLEARAHGIETASGSSSSGSGEAIGQIQLPNGKWEWGKLSVNELGLVLDFLETEGNSKLISDPRITTLNNHEAEIKVTTIVPIQTINRFSEGGAVQDIVTFQDEEIGITLLVTPHITDDNQIILDVNPTVAEIIGYSGPADNQKPITSERSIRTKIVVKNGETAVLGGLLKENRIENEQRLFLLGSLPIIGNLFRHKSIQTNTTDLLILITPRIVED